MNEPNKMSIKKFLTFTTHFYNKINTLLNDFTNTVINFLVGK